jgi:phosphoribosylformylglycinamidine synthase
VIHLKAENTTSPFTTAYKGHEAFPCPIAHHDGNYFIDQDGLKALEDNGQIAFRYCDENGNVTIEANPNGSIENIAGITNKQGNVLGMMPHPENLIEAAHGGIEGRYIFDSLVAAVA